MNTRMYANNPQSLPWMGFQEPQAQLPRLTLVMAPQTTILIFNFKVGGSLYFLVLVQSCYLDITSL
jgi:hypothetical protein